MRILISFDQFLAPAGTETYMVTVAGELIRSGHETSIYSPNQGPMAEFTREGGISVLGAGQLPRGCDLVLASDAATCHELAGRYPDAVIVFIAHSADYTLQAPPQLPGYCQAIVVLNDRVRAAVEARGWHAPVVRLHQPIDVNRFDDRQRAPDVRTVLVMSNYLAGPRARLIERACRANGLKLRWIGMTTEPTPTPEFEIAAVELVIGLGRGALEGMAAGRPVYVYGHVGGDGWVTPGRYEAMEADGFAGLAFDDVVIDERRLATDLGESIEGMGPVNRDLVHAHHSVAEHVISLLKLARGLERRPPVPPGPSEELARLVRLQWSTYARVIASRAEAERLRAELVRTNDALAVTYEQLAHAQTKLSALRTRRGSRLATRLAASLDRRRDDLGPRALR